MRVAPVPASLTTAGTRHYDDDPTTGYLPPMPPPGTVGIWPAPPDAPPLRKVFSARPPPPPPPTEFVPRLTRCDSLLLGPLPPPPPPLAGGRALTPFVARVCWLSRSCPPSGTP